MKAAIHDKAEGPGLRMRSRLLDAAAGQFMADGLTGVSMAEIAEAANAYPSQVTYYFGTKEALFVEAACREVLHLARDVEIASRAAQPGHEYLQTMISGVIGAPALCFFVEALALARRRSDLQPQVKATFDRLDRESARAFAEYQARRGASPENSAVPAHRFWALAIGLTARGAATGEPVEHLGVEMLSLLRMGAAD